MPIVDRAARQRVDTDERVSFGAFLAWVVLNALFVVPAVFVVGLVVAIAVDSVGPFFFFVVVAIIVAAVPTYVFFFRLLDRRNRHFERQQDFCRGVVQCLRERYADDPRPEVANSLASIEGMVNEATMREVSHNPWLWIVLLYTLIPFVGWINAWWLTRDFRDHSVRQRELNDGLNNFFRLVGMRTVGIADDSVVPDRNYWAFLVLTLLTGGLFGLYWIYVMMKDGNDHFARQAFVEDQIVSVLRAAA